MGRCGAHSLQHHRSRELRVCGAVAGRNPPAAERPRDISRRQQGRPGSLTKGENWDVSICFALPRPMIGLVLPCSPELCQRFCLFFQSRELCPQMPCRRLIDSSVDWRARKRWKFPIRGANEMHRASGPDYIRWWWWWSARAREEKNFPFNFPPVRHLAVQWRMEIAHRSIAIKGKVASCISYKRPHSSRHTTFSSGKIPM